MATTWARKSPPLDACNVRYCRWWDARSRRDRVRVVMGTGALRPPRCDTGPVLLHWLGRNVYVPFNNDDQRCGVSTADPACTSEALNLALVKSSATTTADAAAFCVASGNRSR